MASSCCKLNSTTVAHLLLWTPWLCLSTSPVVQPGSNYPLSSLITKKTKDCLHLAWSVNLYVIAVILPNPKTPAWINGLKKRGGGGGHSFTLNLILYCMSCRYTWKQTYWAVRMEPLFWCYIMFAPQFSAFLSHTSGVIIVDDTIGRPRHICAQWQCKTECHLNTLMTITSRHNGCIAKSLFNTHAYL